jgi:4-hydroxybenzoate polyprenyltransferase
VIHRAATGAGLLVLLFRIKCLKQTTIMKIPAALKTKKAENTFSAVLVIFLLLIVPSLPLGKYGGGIAMVAVALIGGIAYIVLFKERPQWGQIIVGAAVAATVAAAIVVALQLGRGHWLWNRA